MSGASFWGCARPNEQMEQEGDWRALEGRANGSGTEDEAVDARARIARRDERQVQAVAAAPIRPLLDLSINPFAEVE